MNLSLVRTIYQILDKAPGHIEDLKIRRRSNHRWSTSFWLGNFFFGVRHSEYYVVQVELLHRYDYQQYIISGPNSAVLFHDLLNTKNTTRYKSAGFELSIEQINQYKQYVAELSHMFASPVFPDLLPN